MKELGMSWKEIKQIPRQEVVALVGAYNIYTSMHSYDGYNADDIKHMAKDKPEIRTQYIKYMQCRRKYEEMLGGKGQKPTFKGII